MSKEESQSDYIFTEEERKERKKLITGKCDCFQAVADKIHIIKATQKDLEEVYNHSIPVFLVGSRAQNLCKPDSSDIDIVFLIRDYDPSQKQVRKEWSSEDTIVWTPTGNVWDILKQNGYELSPESNELQRPYPDIDDFVVTDLKNLKEPYISIDKVIQECPPQKLTIDARNPKQGKIDKRKCEIIHGEWDDDIEECEFY